MCWRSSVFCQSLICRVERRRPVLTLQETLERSSSLSTVASLPQRFGHPSASHRSRQPCRRCSCQDSPFVGLPCFPSPQTRNIPPSVPLQLCTESICLPMHRSYELEDCT